MGGMNHQPCSHYLEESTQLSRSVSSGAAAFLQANARLEDAILAEMHGDHDDARSHWEAALELFAQSQRSVGEILTRIDTSLAKMDELDFQDNAILHTMDMPAFTRALTRDGVISADRHWDDAVATLRAGGYRRMFGELRTRVQRLAEDGDRFVGVFEQGRTHLAERKLMATIEVNAIPFRAWFGRVYSQWLDLQRVFFSSALISIELHYRSCECVPQTSLVHDSLPLEAATN